MKGRGIFFNIKGAALGNSYKTSKNLRTSAPLALLFSIRTTVACDIPKLSPKSLVDKPSSRLNVLSSFPENVSSQRGSNINQDGPFLPIVANKIKISFSSGDIPNCLQ